MLNQLDITKVLFLDIETVSGQRDYEQLSSPFKELWKLKARSVLRQYEEPITEEQAQTSYVDRAGIYAEFGKIVCISVGVLTRNNGKLSVRLKSFASDDEKALLSQFSELLTQYYNQPNRHYLCGHNLREFDVPYICRRMLIHQLKLPKLLDISGKRPWETKHLLDTLEMWKFGDYKNYTSLKLLAACFGFPSPKEDIDGSEVGKVYWEEQDLKRIAVYCEKDTLAVVQLLLKYMREPILEKDQIVFVEE